MKKKATNKTLRDVIMSEESDLIPGNVSVNKKAFEDYLKAQDKLVTLQKQGKLTIIEVDDEEKPHFLHCIYLSPKWDDGDDWEVATRELVGVLKLMDKMVISKGDDTIQLSKKIYEQGKGVD